MNTIVLDLGTTAIKAAQVNKGKIETIFFQSAPKISINKGHYVSDAKAYLTIVEQLLKKCENRSQIPPLLGICYQRSSFLIWDSHNGTPVTPLVSWQDNRGKSSCDALQAQNQLIQQISGLPLTPYYFAPKLHFLLQQQPELLKGLHNKKLFAGTLDSFLIWHWTDGKLYLTDASMAARTLLMDIHTGKWSATLSDIFNIPVKVLPEICQSTELNLELKNGLILQTSVADQSAALLASIANDDSEVLVNLGTGGFVIRNDPEHSNCEIQGYLHTLVYQNRFKRNYIAVEGTLNSITAALQPYSLETCKIEDLAEIDDIFCIAEPSGIGAPYFRPDIGLKFSKATEHLSQQQIACLLLEGIIFRVALILEQFNQQSEVYRVYLSGGLSALPCLQQGIAQCCPSPTYKILQKQSSLQGVAILTNNMEPASYRQFEPISVNLKSLALKKKFLHWKTWFSQIISS